MRLVLTFLLVGCTLTPVSTAFAQMQNRTLTGALEDTYVAANTITAGNATAASGEKMRLRAGQTVRLEPGFRVEAGATFRAETGEICDLSSPELPKTVANGRFFDTQVAPVRHPSLSLNGFDCETSLTGCDNGLGLVQVLDQYLDDAAEGKLRMPFDLLGALAVDENYVSNHSELRHIKGNMQRLQAYAFAALSSYVLEQNGCSVDDYGLPEAGAAATTLKTRLTDDLDSWKIVKDYKKDGVKWTSFVSGIARTVDLYRALENAYCYYGERGDGASEAECLGNASNRLLSEAEKRAMMRHFEGQILRLEDARTWGLYSDLLVDRYEAERGNHSLKTQAAIGSAALVWQNTYDPFTDGVNFNSYQSAMSSFIRRAMHASLRSSNGNWSRYWNYQTGDGGRFWGEGPHYFDFALSDVLPFWHAVRQNDLLDWHPDFDASDPFHDPTFTRPLHWLADVTTPDAKTPPLDNGRKEPYDNAVLLRWTGDYGDGALGRKFAWIADESGGRFATDRDFLVLELAIPRLGTDVGTEPLPCVGGNSNCYSDGSTEEQIVVRREIGGETHYLFLNGESGAAVSRGEAHEDADNMQLLYYVDGTSYLMDSGYDSGNIATANSWNDYWQHNVIAGPGGGNVRGLRAPRYPYETGEAHVVSDHAPAEHLEVYDAGKVTRLHAEQELTLEGDSFAEILDDEWLFEDNFNSTYVRDVLFIEGPEPYVIDVNRNYNEALKNEGSCRFRMNYHIDTEEDIVLDTYDGLEFIAFDGIRGAGSRSLYLAPMAIEHSLTTTPEYEVEYPDAIATRRDRSEVVSYSDDAQESAGGEQTIRRLRICDLAGRQFGVASIIQARSSAPGYQPQVLRNWTSGNRHDGKLDWQGWVWQQNPDVLDVFAARSYNGTFNFQEHIVFNLQAHDPNLPYMAFDLPGTGVGFMRIRRSGGTWEPDWDYGYGLSPASFAAQIDGPDCMQPGVGVYAWTADVFGGVPPYSVAWQKRPYNESSWEFAASGFHYRYPPPPVDDEVDFDLQVEATDATGRSTSERFRVQVSEECDVVSAALDSTTAAVSASKLQMKELPPEEYALKGNYPNPFNPATQIGFDLPETAHVRLTVFDVMGRAVARLVDEEMGAGRHQARFDAHTLPSGVYFYRLNAGGYTATRRMVLVR